MGTKRRHKAPSATLLPVFETSFIFFTPFGIGIAFRLTAMEEAETSSSMSSVSSDLDDENELQSMTGKGIKHLCSELLELKAEAYEDFHINTFSNYSSFVRIFDEVKGMKNELTQLKGKVSTQKKLVKDLIDGIHLKVLSEETIDSILQGSEFSEPTPPSELAVHIDSICETLDVLVLENRVDEAIAILQREEENLQRMQFEDNSPEDLLLLYNSAISEKKAMLTSQLTLSAENLRISSAELQKVLIGICRPGDTHLATQLLLKYYHSRLTTGRHNLQCSESFLDGLYVKRFAKFVFSMISQAASSFMMLYGETSPRASELSQWAREETKLFIASFNKNIKSSVTEGLSKAVEAMQFALSYCSLLKSQRLFLKPYLIKHIRSCMEEVLLIHIDHLKKVISMFTATDDWVLGRYLTSVILSEGNYVVAGQHPEYCLLTNSGWKFVTLLQAIIADDTRLLAIQMEGSILNGLMNLFTEYITILEKAITFKIHVSEKGSRRALAESLPQQLFVLANLSTLQLFFFKIVRSFLRGPGNLNSELRKKNSINFPQKELDDCILFIQEAAAKLKAHFCQQFINRMMSPEISSKIMLCNDSPQESRTFQGAMPSVAFQFVLDVHFLVEIIKYGGYFSNEPLILEHLVDTAFTSAGLDPKRDFDGDGWARNAATEAMQKLLEIETMQLIFEDDSADGLEEEPCENEENELVPDGRSTTEDSLVLDTDAVAITTETSTKPEIPPEGSVSLADVVLEDVDAVTGISEAHTDLYLQERTAFPDPSPSDDDDGKELVRDWNLLLCLRISDSVNKVVTGK
ncbi:hypothetical protein V6N12_022839 [Hibiscus sabdariffa]|uniref:Exocyst component Exo84 C-terminal domain-containing protein n=1 Tax=Hibiscus sabdariffa TaxID=183260 RepID=A0ABR2FVV8_9ROSI